MTEKHPSSIDKRELYRLDISLPTKIRTVAPKGGKGYTLSAPKEAEGINYSGSGALLLTEEDRNITAGGYILMEIRVPEEKEEIRMIGEVVRKKELTAEGRTMMALAIKYLLINEADQDKMIKFIINNGGALRQEANSA